METNQLLTLSPSQLRRAAEIKDQIDRLNGELEGILNGGGKQGSLSSATSGRRRQMSAAGKARIAAAARARWAKVRAETGATNSAERNGTPKRGRTMSAEARKRIAAAQKARWAKVKAAKG